MRRSALFVLALLLASPLQAGVVYEIEVKDHEQSPPKTESIQAAVEGRHLKMGIASGGKGAQGEMIFRGDRREMVVVDHDNRSYHLMAPSRFICEPVRPPEGPTFAEAVRSAVLPPLPYTCPP